MPGTSTNTVPGRRAHEEPAYWRDVGTVTAYMATLRDTEGAAPRFALDNPRWPLHPQRCENRVSGGGTRAARTDADDELATV